MYVVNMVCSCGSEINLTSDYQTFADRRLDRWEKEHKDHGAKALERRGQVQGERGPDPGEDAGPGHSGAPEPSETAADGAGGQEDQA